MDVHFPSSVAPLKAGGSQSLVWTMKSTSGKRPWYLAAKSASTCFVFKWMVRKLCVSPAMNHSPLMICRHQMDSSLLATSSLAQSNLSKSRELLLTPVACSSVHNLPCYLTAELWMQMIIRA